MQIAPNREAGLGRPPRRAAQGPSSFASECVAG